MTKATITRVWIAGLIALAAGLIVSAISIGLMLGYGGHFTTLPGGTGYEFAPRMDGVFWTTVSLLLVGMFIAAVGITLQLVAWIGALVNTYRLEDKTWFAVLLAGGLLGLAFGLVGFAVMVAYVVAGPDGLAIRQPDHTPVAPPQPGALVSAG